MKVTAIDPPCRTCGKTEPVLCYPDDHAQAICPECCEKAEHPDGKTGHQWEYQRWERVYECQYCGIPRQYTDYDDRD